MNLKRLSVLVWVASLLALWMVGCQRVEPASTSEGKVAMEIQLSSPAFTEGGSIPRQYTCDGEDISPPLSWTGVPNEAQSLALIADDPGAARGTWVHWVLFDMDRGLTELPEGITATSNLGTNGINDFGKTRYNGPCPPRGQSHRYNFKLYALDTALNLSAGTTKADVEKAMQGHILVQGQLMGKYGR